MNTTEDKKGFVILVAVLVATLVVSIGAFIALIAVKELELSSSGRESQDAFYAADSALECALYHDFRVEQFGSTGTPTGVRCEGVTSSITVEPGSDTNNSTSYFEISFPNTEDTGGVEQAPYARVRVIKSDIGTINDKTIIEAQGYNIKDTTAQNRVQRALQVVY
jgi:Tfp pilus assembly protein PilX